MFGYIYETTNLINYKTYIGKKTGEFDPNYYGSGVLLKQALKKYGREHFKITILSVHDTLCELNDAEIRYIKARMPPYNIAGGGSGGDTLALADVSYKKQIIEKRQQGMREAWQNLTDEERGAWGKNISDSKKGKATRPADYKHSDNVKQRISESNKTFWSNPPITWRENHANAAKKRRGIPNIHSQSPVEINGKIYDGVIIAATSLKVSRQTINNWIKKGKAKYV